MVLVQCITVQCSTVVILIRGHEAGAWAGVTQPRHPDPGQTPPSCPALTSPHLVLCLWKVYFDNISVSTVPTQWLGGGGGGGLLSYDPKLVNLPAPAPALHNCQWSRELGLVQWARPHHEGKIKQLRCIRCWCRVPGVVFAKMTGHRSLIEYSDPRLAAAQPRTGMGTTHRLQATGSTRQRTLKPLDLTDDWFLDTWNMNRCVGGDVDQW